MNRKRLLSFLKELVSIDSSQDSVGIADYVSSALEKHGHKTRVDSQGNVIASVGRGEGFLLNAHLDTVPAGGFKNAFKPLVKDGRLYGRGATDCKAGVACMMEMALNVNERELGRRIHFTFSAKEEDSSLENNGSYRMVKKVKARRGLVLEPAVKGDTINVGFGCKGIYRCDIAVRGKSAHSGTPWRGVNPIQQLPGFIKDFYSMKMPSFDLRAYGRGFTIPSVASVTQVKAAEGVNVIPQQCTLSVDYRTIPGETESRVEGKIKKICDRNFRDYSILGGRFYSSEYVVDEAFYRFCASEITRHGFKHEPKFSTGRNDITVFKKHGRIKCFSIGPGTSGQSHRNPEYVDLKSMLKASLMIDDITRKYCASNNVL